MKRILAIDYGDVRVGLALSDLTQTIAKPFKTLTYNDFNHLLSQIKEIIDEQDVDTLVIGIPYNMKGKNTKQTLKVKEFASLVKEHLLIDIKFIDERLTSYEAEQVMHKMNIKTGFNKDKIDRIAASIILQEYLQTIP